MVAINRSKVSMSLDITYTDKGRSCRRWERAPKNFCVPRLGYPTEAPPGTVEKMLVFIARNSRGEELFHPSDAKYDGCLRPLLFYLELKEKQEIGSSDTTRV